MLPVKFLKVRGRVIPSTLEDIQLQAEMSDGTIVSGESKIPEARKRIKKMLMKPSNASASKGAVDAILKSDVLIFGPGSLYTSVIPNLLVEEIREAILKSDAVKIYVCNVMTQPGETDGYGAFEHVRALIDHMGHQFLDYVIVNDQKITTEQLKQYYTSKHTGKAAIKRIVEGIGNQYSDEMIMNNIAGDLRKQLPDSKYKDISRNTYYNYKREVLGREKRVYKFN